MAVDLAQELNNMQSLINEDQFQAFLQLDEAQQRMFLEELQPNELINIDLRLDNQFTLPPDELLNLYTQKRQLYNLSGPMIRDPGMGEMPMPNVEQQKAEFIRGIQLKEEGFDYSGLPNAKLRAALSFMETEEEKENLLNLNVGPNSWTKDKYGRYAIMPEFREELGAPPGDQPLIIDNPDKIEWGEDIAEWAGTMPEVVGAIGGGLTMSGYGVLPGMALSGIAAGAAQLGEELIEEKMGYQLQPYLPTEGEESVAGDVGESAAYGVVGELGGRGLIKAGKIIFSPAEVRIPTGETGMFNLKTYTYAPRVDAAAGPGERATYDMVRELLEEKAIPDVGKATDVSYLGRLAGLFESVFGYSKAKNVVNLKYLQDKVNRFLEAEGAEPFDPFMQSVLPKLNESELGALIQLRTAGAKSASEETLEGSRIALQGAIDDLLESLRQPGEFTGIGETIQANIIKAKGDFSKAAGKLYHESDQLMGGNPIIPTTGVKGVVSEILSRLPKEADGTILQGFPQESLNLLKSILNMSDRITTSEAHTLRSLIGDIAYDPSLLKGISSKQFGEIKVALNEAFDQAAKDGLKIVSRTDKFGNTITKERELTPKQRKNYKLGLDKYKEATSKYATEMNKFDKALIKRIAKEFGETGSIPADRVLSTIITRNNPGAIDEIVKAAGKDVLPMLRAGHFDEMLMKAQNVETGDVSAKSLLTQIKNLGTTYNRLYGNEAASIKESLRQIAFAERAIGKDKIQQISAVLGKEEEAGALSGVLKDLTKQIKETDRYYTENFLKNIEKFSPEEVVPWLSKTASSRDVTEFVKFHGAESEAVLKLRTKMIQDILDNLYTSPKNNPSMVIVKGDKLLEAIQKEGVPAKLKAVFGQDTAVALETFAKKAAFLTTEGGSPSGGLVAAYIALNPLQNIGRLIRINILGKLFSNPTTLRYLTTMIESPNTRAVGRATARLGAQVLSLVENDPSVSPEQMDYFKAQLDSTVQDLMGTEAYENYLDDDEAYDNYEDEENE